MKQVILVGALALGGCPGHAEFPHPGADLTVADVTSKLAAKRTALSAFRGASVMDYWIGDQRVKGEVLVMGKPGAMVRFAALSPAGGDTIVDMACNGSTFAFLDKQNNCQLAGPCDRTSIAQFLRIELEPEDFVAMALGNPPVLANATGTVKWDGKAGVDRVELTSAAGKQTFVIDEKNGHFDVVEASMTGPDGTKIWSVANADFGEVADDKGGKFRVPMTTKLVSPREKADLLVAWKDREYNVAIESDKFDVPLPGVPTCGSKSPPPAPAPTTPKP